MSKLKLKKNIIYKFLWFFLILTSLIGIIIMWILVFHKGYSEFIPRKTKWVEKWIAFFYFTHIANLFIMFTSIIIVFDLFKKNNLIQHFLLISVLNSFTILIVFWPHFLIEEKNLLRSNLNFVNDIFLHMFNPLLMIINFFILIFNKKKNINIKFKNINSICIKSLKYSLFPIFWLFFLGLPIYLIGKLITGDSSWAIYDFLDLWNKEIISKFLLGFFVTWIVYFLSSYSIFLIIKNKKNIFKNKLFF